MNELKSNISTIKPEKKAREGKSADAIALRKANAELQKIKEISKHQNAMLLMAAQNNEVYTELANAKGKEREALLIELAKNVLNDSEAIGLMRIGSRVVSDTDHLTRSERIELKKIPAKGAEGYLLLELECDRQAVIKTHVQPKQESIDTLISQLNNFSYKAPIKKRMVLGALFGLIAVMLLPISESINATGNVIGHHGFQITTNSSGIVDYVDIPYGNVSRGQLIARIKNNEAIALEAQEAELEKIEGQIRAQGAYTSDKEGMDVLYIERTRLGHEVSKKREELNNSKIRAERTGIIEWVPNVVGTYVEKGQTIGAINPKEQRNVEVLIDVADWINLEIGDTATFINDRNFNRYRGTVASIPTQPMDVNGGVKFKINLILDEPLMTGTNGQVSIKGSKTVLFAWLFRKQYSMIRAALDV